MTSSTRTGSASNPYKATRQRSLPTGLLATGAEKFHLVVNRKNLQSGSYAAKAEVTPMATGADDGDKQTLDVTIEL